ncbi:MAG: hypothetical protein OJF62_003430 [Pseudolabrys sp.]|jgi:hypothetical protein|nr:hypothetical protein [Pseudolabrys sp.]
MGVARVKLLALGVAVMTLSACTGGGMIGNEVPHAFGGLPADAPQRPAQVAPYPAVHDLPPDRPTPALTEGQQLKVEQDLAAARTRQQRLEDPNAQKESAAANAATAAARDKARAAAGKKPAGKDD